jgi:hypothetical protein
MARLRASPGRAAAAAAVAVVAVLAGGALLTSTGGGLSAAMPWPSATPTALPSLSPTVGPSPTATADPTPGPTIVPVDLFATPTPAPARGALPTDQVDSPAPRRPVPVQSADWLALKAAGRISLVKGKVVVLDPTADPLVNPYTHFQVPDSRTLDARWSRWIVEPLGYGRDAAGNRFSNRNYWNLCEPGATAAALYYWQLHNGYPDVTGMEGWFLDPYAAEGASWPARGPAVVVSRGKRIGTYWKGSDTVNGLEAHGRGYIMYLGMEIQPPGWLSKGIAVYADSRGRPLYPTIGAPRTNIQVALNWEASGHDAAGWSEFWYASVMRFEPTLGRDLRTAVMLDVGRDGVPVVVELDTHGLPNWQAGAATPHIRHAVTIIGYDNTADPPTYTYLDTCGRACNRRAGNGYGQLHVISQEQMVKAIQDRVGSGFVW